MMSALREAPLPDGKPGPFSMRRIGALLMFLAGIAGGILAVVFQLPWQAIAAAFGVPCTIGALLLFFTTWSDVRGIIAAVKGVKDGNP